MFGVNPIEAETLKRIEKILERMEKQNEENLSRMRNDMNNFGQCVMRILMCSYQYQLVPLRFGAERIEELTKEAFGPYLQIYYGELQRSGLTPMIWRIGKDDKKTDETKTQQ